MTVPGSAAQHRLADRAEQVDPAVAGAVGRVGWVEGVDHRGLGLQRPDAHRVGRGARQGERGDEQDGGQRGHAATLTRGTHRPPSTPARLWTKRAAVEAVHDSRTAAGRVGNCWWMRAGVRRRHELRDTPGVDYS